MGCGSGCGMVPQRFTHETSKVAVLQIAFDIPDYGEEVLVLHIARFSVIPPYVGEFFQDGSVKKVGKGVVGDMGKLVRDYQLKMRVARDGNEVLVLLEPLGALELDSRFKARHLSTTCE